LRNLERLPVNTGRIIHRRYLLQRLIQRGAVCAVYQAVDQILQRPVAIKIAPAEHIPAYRAALRSTAQFAHPNIIGMYDLIVEPDALYIVQEYVDGADFKTLLRTPLVPHQIADIGAQICQALIYAGTPTRKVCHGDLTPSAIVRHRDGLIRVNNFALPSDGSYFNAWSVVGGGDSALSDPNLPWGQMSDERKEDDTRAVGLLLYQLLAGRSAEAVSVEPPTDGRLRFMRDIPAELCELTARAVVRMHPEHIRTPEALHAELKALTEALEPATPAMIVPGSVYQAEDGARAKQQSPIFLGSLLAPVPGASPLPPIREHSMSEELGLRKPVTGHMMATEAIIPSSSPIANMPTNLVAARQAAYANLPSINEQPRHINIPVLLLISCALFALFFGLGWMLAHIIFP
jgi:serine/threonine protein kinase